MPSEIRYITVNGVELGYQVHSEGAGKPPAVFVHGYTGRSTDMDAYRPLLARLAEEFTVYALDLRGHGASAAVVDGFSFEAIADDVVEITKALGLVGALYVGHSLGGLTGLFCETRHPRTFSAMCLLATGSAHGGVMSDTFIQHGKDKEFLREAFRTSLADPALLESVLESVVLIDRRVHEAFFDAFPKVDIMEAVRAIDVPTLIVTGAQDAVVPVALQYETAMALPKCKQIIFSTMGHNFPCDDGDLTAREIISFWRDSRKDDMRG